MGKRAKPLLRMIPVLFLVCQCHAQSTSQQVPRACKHSKGLWRPGEINNLADITVTTDCLYEVAFRDRLPNLKGQLAVAYKSLFKSQQGVKSQVGAPSGSGGTTSSVSKPITPLALATEYGGITSSTNNQTVTVQSPLDGVPRAMGTHGDEPYCPPAVELPGCIYKSTLDGLNRFAFGVSLNASAATKNLTATASGSSTGSTQQVSVASKGTGVPSLASAFTKVTLIPQLKLSTSSSVNHGKDVDEAAQEVAVLIQDDPAYKQWQNCIREMKNINDPDAQDKMFRQYYPQIEEVLLKGTMLACPSPPTTQGETRSDEAAKKIMSKLDFLEAVAMLDEANTDAAVAANAPVLSFEYDFNTPQNQPTNSGMKLIFSKGWGAQKVSGSSGKAKGKSGSTGQSNGNSTWTLTFNGGASLYNSTPLSTVPGASLLRDVQVGAELDRVLPTSKLPGWLGKLIGDSTFSPTYYFQDQTSPSILKVTPGTPLTGITLTGLPSTATTLFTQKGMIHVAQLKWGFGTGKNVKFPIAVTYSNRTELITHPAWGLQFGVSYDFTSLLGSGSAGSAAGGGGK